MASDGVRELPRETYSLDEVNDGLRAMEQGEVIRSVIV